MPPSKRLSKSRGNTETPKHPGAGKRRGLRRVIALRRRNQAPGDLVLEEYVPYLINQLGTRISLAMRELLRPLGVSLPVWRILAILNAYEHCTIGKLASETMMDQPTVSRNVQRMEKASLVTRRETGRVTMVRLTPKGQNLYATILPLAHRVEQYLTGDMTRAELTSLKKALRHGIEGLGF